MFYIKLHSKLKDSVLDYEDNITHNPYVQKLYTLSYRGTLYTTMN